MKKNKKLAIIVMTLLATVGVSFAWFIANTLITGSGANTKLSAASPINVKYDAGTSALATTGLTPGHSVSKSFTVTVTPGDIDTKATYRIYMNITTNTFEACTSSNYNSITNACTIGAQELTYTLKDSNNTVISSGDLTDGVTGEIELAKETKEVSTATAYTYTLTINFIETNADQNHNANKTLNGNVKVEYANEHDIDIMAVYLEQNNGNYQSTDTIPISGYVLNTTRSTCSNSATPTWDSTNNGLLITNLTSAGTSCDLYFDIKTTITLAGIEIPLSNISEGSTEITGIADTDEGIKYISDGMYGGTTYYYRGAVNNNWVKFAGMYWRIIRFNGDGSIRLIYSGTTAPTSSTATVMTGTGTRTTDSAFNSSYNDAIYVGFKYASSDGHGTSSWSTIADYLVGTGSGGWYSSSGLSSYASYIADGKFCNDRTTNGSYFSGYTSTTGYGTSNTVFAPATRVFTSSWSWNGTQTISTSCTNSSDIFTTKVGLITSDEVLMAGGFGGTGNSSYYLYTNHYYWTMSPYYFSGSNSRAYVFFVRPSGDLLTNDYVPFTYGVRPVINLKAETEFTGSGTYDDVYKVVGTND